MLNSVIWGSVFHFYHFKIFSSAVFLMIVRLPPFFWLVDFDCMPDFTGAIMKGKEYKRGEY